MQLRPEIQIKSMIKAMTEVVLPAVDENNALAVEQAQLIIGHLNLIAVRLPLQFRADRNALDRLISYTHDVLESSDGEQAALVAAQADAADVLSRAKAEPQELVDAARRITEELDDNIRAIFDGDDEKATNALMANTLKMSEEQLLRDRSWLIMQGWEPDASIVPPIESLLEPLNSEA
ncbi:MAG: hypothetical protein V7676_17870 [Parasphingorhabdus sp.]|uniref:hypothetical protein n=1 Tax=Parasphingorhabdus sp. TaxID=2709688 RepID=UPI0030030B38